MALIKVGRIMLTMLLGILLAGCTPPAPAPEPNGDGEAISFIRPALEELPEEVRRWVDDSSRERGTDIREHGDATYVLVAWGEKPTGGYDVEIEEVARGREREVVVVKLTAPEPGRPVTQAVTHPFGFIATERKLGRPVVFAYRGDLTLTSPLPLQGGNDHPPVASSKNFQIFAPAPGTIINSPVRVAGEARVFEGNFFIEIEDGHNLLARQQVQTNGAPEWGPFDLNIPFDQPTSPGGAIIFVTYSPLDGSRQEELILPVSFR